MKPRIAIFVCLLPLLLAQFDSPLRSVAWGQLSDAARAAVVLGCVVIPAVMLCLLAAGGRRERRLGLAMVGVLALLAPLSQAGAATRWVASPTYCATVGCGAEDGTENAPYNGWQDAWAVAGNINAGDTVCVKTDFIGLADADQTTGTTHMLRVRDTGSAGNILVFDGDCDGDGRYATFDGLGEVVIGIKADGGALAAQPTYLKITRLNIRNFTKGISNYYNATTDATNDAHHTFTYLDIRNIGDGAAGSIGFDGRGNYTELSYSYIDGTDEDAVFNRGKHFKSSYLKTRNFSRTTSSGDGIQLSLYADYAAIDHYDCIDVADAKQCLIASVLSDTGAQISITDSRLQCVIGGTVSNCAYLTGQGAKFLRNYVSGGRYAVNIESDATNATGILVASNIIRDGKDANINMGSGTGANNRILNNTLLGSAIGIQPQTTAATEIANNIIVGATGCGIDKNSTHSEHHNVSWGNGIDFCQDLVLTAPGTGSFSADPQFIGGPNPTTVRGFRLKSSSPLIGAGTCYLTGSCAHRDFDGRRHLRPPNIGAFATGFGDQK